MIIYSQLGFTFMLGSSCLADILWVMVVLMNINDELSLPLYYISLVNTRSQCLIGTKRTTHENSATTRTKRALVLAN
jgi:hypothetical protein